MDNLSQQILSRARGPFYEHIGFTLSHHRQNFEDLLHDRIFTDHIREGVFVADGSVEFLDQGKILEGF